MSLSFAALTVGLKLRRDRRNDADWPVFPRIPPRMFYKTDTIEKWQCNAPVPL